MARENSPSYAKTGFMVFLGIGAIAATIAYFGGWARGADEIHLETYYENPVSGLSVGSPVSFRGVAVGSVKSVSFIGRDYPMAKGKDREKIHIVFSVNTALLGLEKGEAGAADLERKVKMGLRATLRSNGITGLSRLDLDYPLNVREPKAISWSPKRVFVPPALSMFENLSDSLTRTVNHLNRMNLPEVGSNLTATVASSARLTANMNDVVETAKPRLDEILDNLSAASASLRELADEVKSNPSLLLRSRDEEPLEETR